MNDQLLESLLREDEGTALDFKRDQYPFVGVSDDSVKSELLNGNYLADHRSDEWTYEIDNADQITLRYCLDSLKNVSEEINRKMGEFDAFIFANNGQQ